MKHSISPDESDILFELLKDHEKQSKQNTKKQRNLFSSFTSESFMFDDDNAEAACNEQYTHIAENAI